MLPFKTKIREKLLKGNIAYKFEMRDDECEKLKALAIIISENLTYAPEDEVIQKVKEKMPELTVLEILEWINCAKRLLFREEYLTDEIKKELELWKNVD